MKKLIASTAVATILGLAAVQAQQSDMTPAPADQAADPGAASTLPADSQPGEVPGAVEPGQDAAASADQPAGDAVSPPITDPAQTTPDTAAPDTSATMDAPATSPVTTTPATTADATTDTAPMITPPDGYTLSDAVLTADDILGASVLDASGDDIGNVEGVVFDNGTTHMQGGDATADGVEVLELAVIDVGGFLGMGAHRVAVPAEELRLYRSDGDSRVYLPWTREQLEALPEFDEDNPSAGTL